MFAGQLPALNLVPCPQLILKFTLAAVAPKFDNAPLFVRGLGIPVAVQVQGLLPSDLYLGYWVSSVYCRHDYMDLESLLRPNALNSKPRIRGKMRASQLPQTKEEIRSMALKVRSLPV